MLYISKAITIRAENAGQAVLDGMGTARVILVSFRAVRRSSAALSLDSMLSMPPSGPRSFFETCVSLAQMRWGGEGSGDVVSCTVCTEFIMRGQDGSIADSQSIASCGNTTFEVYALCCEHDVLILEVTMMMMVVKKKKKKQTFSALRAYRA